MTTNPTDIVAYTFQGANYHPRCLMTLVVESGRAGTAFLTDGDAESGLGILADAWQYDRSDESSYDSDDFPKVVFLDQVLEGECCFRCGEDLVEFSSNPWQHATERD